LARVVAPERNRLACRSLGVVLPAHQRPFELPKLGHPVLDRYLRYVAVRCRPNAVLATASNLKAFFSVVAKEPDQVEDADLLAFIREQRRHEATQTWCGCPTAGQACRPGRSSAGYRRLRVVLVAAAARGECGSRHYPPSVEDLRRVVVQAGYDQMAREYLDYIAAIAGDPRLRFLAELQSRLPPGSTVLDLGCGAGEPCTRLLAEEHDVVGVDLSGGQLRLARDLASDASFVQADLAHFHVLPETLDAVTAFYSLTHVPRDEHARVLRDIATWLKPGGSLLLTLSARGETDGIQDDFIGVPMYFSGFGPDRNRELLDAAGFALLIDEVVEMQEPDGQSSFQWVLAQRAALQPDRG